MYLISRKNNTSAHDLQILDNIHGSKTWEDISLKIQNCLQFGIYQVIVDSVKVELKQEMCH